VKRSRGEEEDGENASDQKESELVNKPEEKKNADGKKK